MQSPAYQLVTPPRRTTCVLFASPHGSDAYPAAFLAQTALQLRALRSTEDAFVNRLFDSATEFGAGFLMAGTPRAYIDLNRGADELDPALIQGVRSTGHNPRVTSGLGVVPRVVANGRAIYQGKLPLSEIEHRIRTCWAPYHERLETELQQIRAHYGRAILIDCHSMPSESLDGFLRRGERRPDVVLGDRYGASASALLVDRIESAFRTAGFHVKRNHPFAGAYTVQRYGRPAHGLHAVQVEIDRALYMDQARIEPNERFDKTRERLRTVIAAIADLGRADGIPMAAE